MDIGPCSRAETVYVEWERSHSEVVAFHRWNLGREQYACRMLDRTSEHAERIAALLFHVSLEQPYKLTHHERMRSLGHRDRRRLQVRRTRAMRVLCRLYDASDEPVCEHSLDCGGEVLRIFVHPRIITRRAIAPPVGMPRTLTSMSARGGGRLRATSSIAGAMGLFLGIASCTSSSPAAAPVTTQAGPTTSTIESATIDDGVLRIGVLLPASGKGASIGQSARPAVRVAVERANRVGGVNGKRVEIVVRDEGADAVSAGVSVQQLIEARVDVIVGPASSNTAIALMPAIVSAGVPACSPSASALALDSFPSAQLLFRTIASDNLQSEAMARIIEQTGEDNAAIAYIDDAYGRPFAAALEAALKRRNVLVTTSLGFTLDDDEFATEAQQVAASGTGPLALIGDADAGSRMLVALGDATALGPRDIVVNDTLRQPWSSSVLGSIRAATRLRITGVSQSVSTSNETLLQDIRAKDATATGLFATQSFDCATMFMLAAAQGASSVSADIADQMYSVGTAGSACDSFEQCVVLVGQGRNIDYEGLDGFLELVRDGDLATAKFEVFGFDEGGRDVTLRTVTVGVSGR